MLAKSRPFFLLCSALAVMLAWLCPYHIHPFRSYYNDLAMLAALALLMLGLSRRAGLQLPLPSLAAVPLFLVAVILLQGWLMPLVYPPDQLFSLAYLFAASLAVCLGAAVSGDQELRQRLLIGLAGLMLLAAVISVWIQITQLAGMNITPFVMYLAKTAALGRPYANIAQPNQLALILCFGMAANWLICLYRLTDRWTALASMLFILCGLVLTQSRIGWIIVPLFSVLMAWNGRRRTEAGWQMYLFMPAIYFSLVLMLPHLVGVLGYSGGSVAEHIGGRSERLGLWKQALHMANSHPFAGVGWAGFGPEQIRIAADFPVTTYAEHAHNLFLNFAAELGWPVTLLLTLGAVLWAYRVRRLADQPLNLFAILCLSAALVHSMVEFPLWYAYILLPVAFLMGYLHQQVARPRCFTLPFHLINGVILAAVLSATWMTWDYQRVVAGFNVLRWQPEATVQRSKALQPPEYTLYPEFFIYFKLMGMHAEEGMAAEQIAYIEKWTPRFGFVHILNKLAEVSVLNGKPEQAGRAMKTMQKLHPDSYPEYYDYWQAKAAIDPRYMQVFNTMPDRNAQ